MKGSHILLVEDDERLAHLVREYLQQHDYHVQLETRGDDAVARFDPQTDLVILDLMIPGIDGIEVCRELRTHYRGPLMMLTAKGSDIDQVLGLELGADDYVVKPVEPPVLLARIRALLRRGAAAVTANDEMRFGTLRINRAAQEVALDGRPLALTTQEFDLLCLLASRPGEVQSRAEIYRKLRGREYDGLDRTVDVCVSHLRKKLGDDGERPQLIKTIWGKGYLFVADGWG
ncbi:MAG: DNA-binding response regulator [Halioglobus sp.]|nr:DNA-binding response regulator [Halioglobus sp.]|tara:strand:- start:137 stop:829 length:693 start_codon:yes stop_codon:yes gene_type:complete